MCGPIFHTWRLIDISVTVCHHDRISLKCIIFTSTQSFKRIRFRKIIVVSHALSNFKKHRQLLRWVTFSSILQKHYLSFNANSLSRLKLVTVLSVIQRIVCNNLQIFKKRSLTYKVHFTEDVLLNHAKIDALPNKQGNQI